MNPYPFNRLNHLTIPLALTFYLRYNAFLLLEGTILRAGNRADLPPLLLYKNTNTALKY